MPTPKQMLWIVALAGGTFFAIEHVRTKQSGGSSSGGARRYGA